METVMNTTLKTLTLALPFAFALGATTPALAFEFAKPVSVTVRHADLDLNSVSGRATLNHRINGAVKRVCGVAGSQDLRQNAAVQRCRIEAASAAHRAADAAIARATS
jgi:UrcA family protein